MSKLTAAMMELAKGIKRLDTDHGIVGRRNSRAVVLKVLKKIRTALDADYPTITRKRKKQRSRARAKKTRVGWMQVRTSHAAMHVWAAVKVPMRLLGTHAVEVPEWVVACGSSASNLRACKRSINKRKEITAAYMLRKTI